MTIFRCPHCGAETAYDPSKGKVICEHCGSELTVDDYSAYLDEKGLYQTNELSCRQCGATILSTDNTVPSSLHGLLLPPPRTLPQPGRA